MASTSFSPSGNNSNNDIRVALQASKQSLINWFQVNAEDNLGQLVDFVVKEVAASRLRLSSDSAELVTSKIWNDGGRTYIRYDARSEEYEHSAKKLTDSRLQTDGHRKTQAAVRRVAYSADSHAELDVSAVKQRNMLEDVTSGMLQELDVPFKVDSRKGVLSFKSTDLTSALAAFTQEQKHRGRHQPELRDGDEEGVDVLLGHRNRVNNQERRKPVGSRRGRDGDDGWER